MGIDDVAFYSAARAAVERYVREIALLPSFPSDAPLTETDDVSRGVVGPVLRVAATNQVAGQILPRTDETWLAIRPFQDITKSTLPAWASALVERRLSAVALLVRLSASPHFGWDAMMDCGGEKPLGLEKHQTPRRTFWLELLRALSPDAAHDRSMALERNLVALSRATSPRFLLCVDSDPSQVDFGMLLDQFLWANKTDVVEANGNKNVFDETLSTCGLSRDALSERVIELGLSFTTGKITHATMSKLFDVLDRLRSSERRADGIRFRITALRVGEACVVQPKALETFAERWKPHYDIRNLSLGSIDDIKPSAVQQYLHSLSTRPSSLILRRLGTIARDCFPAFVSLFRASSTIAIDHVDVAYDPTEENAAWLAFAFFHVDARSSVSSICLRMKPDQSLLSEEWMDAFERTLRSHTACEDLTGEDDTSDQNESNIERARTFVTLQAATPVKSHPHAGAKLVWKVPSKRDSEGGAVEYERIATVKKLVGVIIPGLGVGWAPATSIVETRTIASLLPKDSEPLMNRRVTSLSIDRTAIAEPDDTTRQHITTLLHLLSMVGEPLECLELPDCHFEQQDLARLLSVCPNLKTLNISGHRLTDLRPLVDAYAAQQCQIESLSLARPFTMPNDDDIVPHMTTLLRLEKPPPLRQLAMHLISHHNTGLLAPKSSVQEAEALAHAMSAHPTLSFVQLTTLTPTTVDVTLQLGPLPLDFSQRFDSQPLGTNQKLAFLSVLHQKYMGATGQLDALTTSLIFAFSRQSVARHVLRCN